MFFFFLLFFFMRCVENNCRKGYPCLSSQMYKEQCFFLTSVCVFYVCKSVCVCGLAIVMKQFAQVDFFVLIFFSLLLSVPMLPPSPMQQGQVWKVCTIYHLPLIKPRTPPFSPFLYCFLFLPSLHVLLATRTDLLVPSFVPHSSSCLSLLRVRPELHSLSSVLSTDADSFLFLIFLHILFQPYSTV